MLKLDRTAATRQFISAADHVAFTYPNADWAEYTVVGFTGSLTGSDAQYITSNSIIGTQGLNFTQVGTGDSNTAARQRVALYLGSGTTIDTFAANQIVPGETRVLFKVRSAGVLYIKSCPILSTAPANGSAVVTETSIAISTAYDGTSFALGNRVDNPTGRNSDQAFGRFGKIERALTDHELAKIAYGMRIADLGYTPSFDATPTASGVADAGPNNIQFTVNGSPAVVADPEYGFGAAASVAPTISGSPAINGTPQVGVSIGYTPAAVTGTAPITRTQQWTIDGVDISGATSATYVPVSGDSDKSLRVRQTETNVISTGNASASATSAPATVAAATPTTNNTIIVTAPANRRFFQRNGNTAVVPLSGTYTGSTPNGIEYLLHDANGLPIGTWLPMSSTIGNGVWSASPNLSVGGPYRIATRSTAPGGAVIATSEINANLFFVGTLHAWIGSSSAEKRFIYTSGTGFTPRADVGKYSPAGWAAFVSAGCAILEANSLAVQSAMPVCMLDYGVSGTTLDDWLNTAGSQWTSFANAVAAVGGKLETVMIAIGSNDAAEGIVASREQHAANLRLLISRIRTLTGQPSLPVLLSGMNRRDDVAMGAQPDMVRMAENDVGEDTGVYHVQTLDLLNSSDKIHLSSSDAGFPASARRNAYVMGRKLYGDGVYARGPKITAFNYEGNIIKVSLQHRNGTDITLAVVPNGFAASDINGSVVVQNVAKASATQLEIICDRPLGNNAKITYLAGQSPAVNQQSFDNGSTPLPMHAETGLQASTASGTGSFTSNQFISSDTIRVNQTCSYTWHSGGIIGVSVGVPTYGSATLSPQGTFTVPNLPFGSGFMLVAFSDGGVAYQTATIA